MWAGTKIVIVGGGIVAASVAYHLTCQDVSVTLVDAGLPGAATDAGAGIVCPWTEPQDNAVYRLSADGARYYPQLLASLSEDGQADTGYARVGTLCVAEHTTPLQAIAATVRARVADRPEIGEVTMVGQGQPQRLFPPLAARLAGLWISGAARVDGRAIRDSLIRAAVRKGACRVHGVAVLAHSRERVTGVTVGRDRLAADAVVVAAGAWTAQVCAGLGWQLPVRPQRGQILHAQMPGADTGSWPVILPPGDPYLLGFPGGRIVFGATREDAGFEHRATVGGVGAMLAAAVQIAPGLRYAALLETRIGFRPVTADGRPMLGKLADGLVVATGNGAEGLTAGPWMGLAAAALALDQQPTAEITPFDPARFR